jgi:hypothetical protein
MPEKFGFACFLERLATSDPHPVIDATAALFCEHLGPAIELMLLDWKTVSLRRGPPCGMDWI